MNRKQKAAIDEAKSLVAAIQGDERKLSRLAEQRSDKQWELARLTFENTRGNAKDSSADGTVPMVEWADAVGGLAERTFKFYRLTWAKYGDERLVYADGSEALFGDHIAVVRGGVSEHDVNEIPGREARVTGEAAGVARGRIAGQEIAAAPSKLTATQREEIAREVIHAKPSIVADAIVENTDVAKAIAKDKVAREVVERKAADQREREYLRDGGEQKARQFEDAAERVADNIGRAVGQPKVPEFIRILNGAAKAIAEAIVVKDIHEEHDPIAEAEALANIERAVAIYRQQIGTPAGSHHVNKSDRAWLDSLGVTL